MTVRTRLAPSPTGFMHIGTLRTALWDYFLAKKYGGQFIIRIEDTDQERFVEGALESLLATFKKVGITHDEGPMLLDNGSIEEKGDVGPYIQSHRLATYQKYADQLVAAGHAYVCFCTPERLTEMRAQQTAAKQTPKYDRHCLRLERDDVAKRLAAGEAHVIRMKIPEGTSEFTDAIRGHISFNNADVDDQVIIKSNGFASYHLAVIVDDHLMGITHVLRGEEWTPSTPKQIILSQMLGWDMPTYAHVPLLLNSDKTKLSKRKGDVSVESYLAKGYLPAALLNFIATLGFNPTADREIYTLDELIAAFDLAKVNRAGAVMNIEKLDWMNHQYLMQLSDDDLVAAVRPFVTHDVEHPAVRRGIVVEKPRVQRLDGFEEALKPYAALPTYDASILAWKKADAADARMQLTGVQSLLIGLPDEVFGAIMHIEDAVKVYIAENGLQNGNVLWPLRVALSGMEKSASPYEFIWALGRDASLRRIAHAISLL